MFKKIMSFVNKVNMSCNAINNIDNLFDYKIRSGYLLNSVLKNTDMITTPTKKGDTELIVSFTTYNKRIHDVHLVIESIAQQIKKPNRLILWLDEEEFTLDTIPLILHNQIARGLDIRFCPNYGSYKKLIPTLEEFPEANIITIDDDVLYPYDMIEGLHREHEQSPQCIIANRVHKIIVNDNGDVAPYKEWQHGIQHSSVSSLNMAIGVGGILYPSGSLHLECLNINVFEKLAPNADDIWFKAMALLNDTKCKKVNDNRDFFSRFLLIHNSQDIALKHKNITENDEQLKAVIQMYNLNFIK